MALSLKYFEKTYKVPRKFASPRIQTSLVPSEISNASAKSWVWQWDVVNDSEKWYPQIINSISQSSKIPLELLGERDREESCNDTAVLGFKASSNLPDLC